MSAILNDRNQRGHNQLPMKLTLHPKMKTSLRYSMQKTVRQSSMSEYIVFKKQLVKRTMDDLICLASVQLMDTLLSHDRRW